MTNGRWGHLGVITPLPVRQLLVCLLSAGLLVSLGCGRSATGHLESGRRLETEGKLTEASFEYRKAIDKDSGSAAAQLALGDVSMKLGNLPAAYFALTRASEIAPGDPLPRVKLADLALTVYARESSRPQWLYDLVKKIVGELRRREPDSPDALRFDGELALFDQDPGRAVELLSAAALKRPGIPEITVPLVQALIQAGRGGEAVTRAGELLAKRKDVGEMYDVLAAYYRESGNEAAVESTLKRKVQSRPKDPEAVVQLALNYARLGRPDDATRTISLLASPGYSSGRLVAGDFYLQTGDLNRARSEYEAADGLTGRKRLIRVLLQEGRRAEAIRDVNELLKASASDVELRAMKASFQIERADPAALKAAVDELKILSAQSPDNGGVSFQLGRALLASGNVDGAEKELTKAALSAEESTRAKMLLADILLRRGRHGEAVAAVSGILRTSPGVKELYVLRAAAWRLQGQFPEADKDLRDALRLDPAFVGAHLELATLRFFQRRPADAEAILRTALRQSDGSFEVFDALVRLLISQGKPREALAVASERVKTDQSRSTRRLLAWAAVQAGQVDAGLAMLEKLAAESPDLDVLMQLGRTYEGKGDYSSAVARYRQARQVRPSDGAAAAALGNALLRAGRTEEAIAEYSAAVKLSHPDPEIRNNLAYLLAESGRDLDRALALAQEASKAAPANPDYADTLGWVYVRKRMTGPAVYVFESLVKRFPGSPTYRHHLAVALVQKGENTRARKELESALRADPDEAERKAILALLAKLP